MTALIEARVSVNWPHTMKEAIEQNRATGATRLTQRFVDHVMNYDNWSVEASLLKIFPEIAGRIRIHDG